MNSDIYSLGPDDWHPLFALIPEIEQTTNFGEDSFSPVIFKFLDLCYRLHLVIDFNWPDWNEGRALTSPNNPALRTIDLLTACKLLTAIIRNDRFCEGALSAAFEEGLIRKILYRIRELVLGGEIGG
jgi:hypothetical protein